MDLVWTRSAAARLREIVGLIAADNPAEAARFIDDIREAASTLTRFPRMGRVGRARDTREWRVRRFYLLTYRVWADRIEILQIWHTSQHRQ